MSEKNSSAEAFNNFMLSTLERSGEFSHRLRQRSFNAIQLFWALLTGFLGVAIVIITSVDDEVMKVWLLVLIFAAIGSFGALTYLWILVSLAGLIREKAIRFFLQKYFRDLNPSAFDKYGLSILSGVYSQFQGKDHRSVTMNISLLSALLLAIFSSAMVAAAVYFGLRNVMGNKSLLISFLLGFIWLVILLVFGRIPLVQEKKNRVFVSDILNNLHNEEGSEKVENIEKLPTEPS